jgi:hypothetical protein
MEERAKKSKAMLISTLSRGAVSGIAGGLVLSLIVTRPWFGPDAPVRFFFAHLLVSAIWGAAFGFTFYGLDRGLTFAAGLLWGLVAWLTMYYVVAPIAGYADIKTLAPPAISVLDHLAFGATLALVFSLIQKNFGKRKWDHDFSRWWDAE